MLDIGRGDGPHRPMEILVDGHSNLKSAARDGRPYRHGRDGARPYIGSKIWFPTSVRTADPAVLGRVGSRVRTQNSNIVFLRNR